MASTQQTMSVKSTEHGLNPNFLKYAQVIQKDIASNGSTVQPNLQHLVKPAQSASIQGESQGAESHDLEPILKFLSSADADVVSPANENDMSHPMSHYFISSSHNTYLTGNQLYSNASVDGYMRALKINCRCVEIDVWDGKVSEEEKIEKEVHGIRDRLHLNDRSPSPHGKKESDQSHSGIRAKLGLHKKSSPEKASSKPDPLAADRAKLEAQKASEMPKPWRASSEPDPEPRVLHGHTFTKEVPFRRVCQAIAVTAFSSSDLPVIVSLEVHCGLEQQEMMVKIMRNTWGDHLLDVTRYATGSEPEYTAALPSPESLRNKILIKVKYTPPEKAAKNNEKGDREASGSSSEDEDAGDAQKEAKPQKKKKILDELSLLGVYTRSFHFKNFTQKEAQIPTHVFALSENKLKDSIENHSEELSKHNTKYFMRAYPKGVRVSSSNLNPIPIWRHGVQMVALNWQSCDKAIMLNEGMFGGTKGWVLKPQSYWDPTRKAPADTTAPDEPSSKDVSRTSTQTSGRSNRSASLTPSISQDGAYMQPPKHMNFRISFYTAQDLPLPEGVTDKHFHPYVKVILHTEALPSQRARSRSTSRSPSPNGRSNPDKQRQSARERASSLLQDYASRRGRPKESERSNDPSPTKAKPKLKRQICTYRSSNPDFGGETASFENVPVDTEAEYMTFVRVKVYHDVNMGKDDMVAWGCARLGRLRKGWGMWHLKDKNGEDSQAKMLVRVQWDVSSAPAA